MTNITREKIAKQNGEVFTPIELVSEILNSLDIDWGCPPQDKTFVDPACGTGNFLVELANRGIPIVNLYGVELMPDNVEDCKERLLLIAGDNENNRTIVNNNIVCTDSLGWDFELWLPGKN